MVVQRDRSQELYGLFDQMKQSRSAVGSSDELRPVQAIPTGQAVRLFNQSAQKFSEDIATVSASIMDLTKLTHLQSAFNDCSTEFADLTQMVKGSLQRLRKDLDDLETLKRQAINSQKAQLERSSGADRRGFFNAPPDSAPWDSQKHSDTVVETLKNRLTRAGQDFRNTLQQQSKSMKTNASRRHLYTAGDRPQSFESALVQHQEQHQQQQQLVSGTSNAQYYSLRVEAVREIEAAVAETSELFSEFTRLVHEQDEVVLRIDADVDTALTNVNAGSNELMRYLANLSSNRGLILKIFAILFFFLLFFGLVVVR